MTKTHRTPYTDSIQALDPDCDPRHVEAWMRLEYGTLDHLPESTFHQYIKMVRAIDPADSEALAASYGL